MAFRTLLAALAASAIPSTLAQSSPAEEFGPSTKVAAQRGPQIFNTVYDTLQKWGAVVHPNGMSLFLATVPEGVMLHHGNNRNETPTELQWLAYEIEHAEMFARGGRRGPGGGPGKPPGFDSGREDLKRRNRPQAPLMDAEDEPAENEHGWLHTYRTTRPLRFLYIDGMSGNKDSSGVLDTQDLLLRGVRSEVPSWPPKGVQTHGPPGEKDRALDLCRMCADWGLHGVIRTEFAGHEIIKCDFSDGLEQVQSLQRSGTGNRPPHGGPPGGGPGGGPPGGGSPGGGPPGGGPPGGGFPGGPGGRPGGRRSEADRNRGITSDRTLVDYSSMVSAYFFPVNITNPDSEQAALPRLLNTTEAEMASIRTYLSEVVKERYDAPIATFNWRDIADLVVRRYATQLTKMSNETDSIDDMSQQVRFLLDVFINYAVEDEDVRGAEAEERCSTFYFQTMPLKTDADHLLYAAFKAVNAEICAALFQVRKLVGDSGATDESLEEAKTILKSLIKYLAWIVFE